MFFRKTVVLLMVLSGISSAWAADYPNTILTTIENVGNVRGIFVSSDNARLYAAIWEDANGSRVLEYDLADYSLLQTLTFGDYHTHGDVVLSADDRFLFTSNYYYSNVSRVDLENGNARSDLYVGSSWPGELDITPDRSKILVKVGMDGRSYDMNNDQITIIDAASYTILAQVILNDEPSEKKIGFSTDGTKAYVTTNRRKSSTALLYEISLLPPYNILRTAPIVGGSWPNWGLQGVAVTDSRIFVCDYFNGQILVFDLASFGQVGTIAVGGNPGVLAITPDGQYLYALNPTGQYISVVDLATENIVETIVGFEPVMRDIEFSSDGSRAYVCHGYPTSGVITVIGQAIEVNIDIKPRSCPNPLNVGEKGVIPVAVLGSSDFDVAEIDQSSIYLESVAPIPRFLLPEDVSAPVDDPEDECDCDTLSADGFIDQVFLFDAQQVVAALGEVHDGDVIQLTLSGLLNDGSEFEGSDCILIRRKGANDTRPKKGIEGDPAFAATRSYPNPFNARTLISFTLPEESHVVVEVYDLLGRSVAKLLDGNLQAGYHEVVWDAIDQPSGLYFYRIQAGEFTDTRKMLLLK